MKTVLRILVPLSLALAAAADDVWLVQADANGWGYQCVAQSWASDAILQNTAGVPATVTLRGVSGGAPIAGPADLSFTIAPHRTVSMDLMTHGVWRPTTFPPLWIVHVDVPQDVLVESRVNVGQNDLCVLFPINRNPTLGKLSFPVFRALVPASQLQTFVGSDLGMVSARTNVGVYNAGSEQAQAHMELRRACDDVLLASVEAEIAPNAFVQASLFPSAPPFTVSCVDAPGWVSYTTLLVTQPSLAYVTVNANDVPQTQSPILSVPVSVNRPAQ